MNCKESFTRSEVERRKRYFEELERKFGGNQATGVIKQCLHNNPSERPSAEALLDAILNMKVQFAIFNACGGAESLVNIMATCLVCTLPQTLNGCEHAPVTECIILSVKLQGQDLVLVGF